MFARIRSAVRARRLPACGMVIGAVCGMPVWANGPGEVTVLDGPAKWLSCLAPSAAEFVPIIYPPEQLSLNKGATVKVRIKFTGAGSAPDMDFFYNTSGDGSFESAVKERVSTYRLPCLPAGADPVVVTQVFSFLPEGRRVVYGRSFQDGAPSQKCRFVTQPEELPRFPSMYGGRSESGAVLMEMTFIDKDTPPALKVLYESTGGRHFVRAVERHLEEYRMDCSAPYHPVTVKQMFRFRRDAGAGWGLPNLSLKQFVSALDDLESQRVRFEFADMGCPFDLRVKLYKPYATNEVYELDRSNPARREFIEWLRGVALKLPAAARDDLLGSSVTLSVPCGVLDLAS